MQEAFRDAKSLANAEKTEKKGPEFNMPSSGSEETAFHDEKPEETRPEGTILNKDIPVIWDLQILKEEVRRMEEEQSWLRDRLYATTKSLSMAPGGGSVRAGFEEIMARIADIDEKYDEVLRTYTEELNRAEKIIKAIRSASMRLFVRMYYKDHADKKIVMEKVKMTEWGFRKAKESIEGAPCMAAVNWSEKFRKT